MNVDDIAELRRFITVAHHVPGRIRLKLNPAVRHPPKAAGLASLFGNGNGAVRARLNILARSLVLEYDPGRIDPGRMEEFFASDDADPTADLARELSAAFGLTPQA
ncbi:MAG: cation transporter [Desulfovibrio sp.]|nr:cation transporter [Desulfovibrio sp.]